MSTPVSPTAFTISDTTHNGAAAFPFFISLIDSLAISVSIKRDTPLTVSIFLIFITDYQYNISYALLIFITDYQYNIISYALLTNNTLISFVRPLCSLKHITFLITSSHKVFRSFPFYFAICNILTLTAYQLYFWFFFSSTSTTIESPTASP